MQINKEIVKSQGALGILGRLTTTNMKVVHYPISLFCKDNTNAIIDLKKRKLKVSGGARISYLWIRDPNLYKLLGFLNK